MGLILEVVIVCKIMGFIVFGINRLCRLPMEESVSWLVFIELIFLFSAYLHFANK